MPLNTNTLQTDVAIAGGGLSGLTCALMLAKRGRRVALVTGGNSLLELFSGSMGLVATDADFAKGIKALDKSHPYRRIGTDKLKSLALQARNLLAGIGLRFSGNGKCNHYRLSPLGQAVPAWLTMDGFATMDTLDAWQGKRITLMGVPGYLDQAELLVTHNLNALGATVVVRKFALPQLSVTTPTPRPTTLSRKLDGRTALSSLAADINAAGADADMVLMPAIMGDDEAALAALMRRVTVPLRLMPTLPPTTAGNLLATTLRHYLLMMGGTVVTAQTVTGAVTDGNRVSAFTTSGGMTITAREFVLATGHLASGGLLATPGSGGVVEPVLGLDLSDPAPDTPERFATTGIVTDGNLRPSRGGNRLDNVSVTGSLLGGHDAATMHDSEGVDLLTALHVAARL